MDGQEVLMTLLPDVGNWQLEGITFEGQTQCLTFELCAKQRRCACPTCQGIGLWGSLNGSAADFPRRIGIITYVG
jgi:hypothetical protein